VHANNQSKLPATLTLMKKKAKHLQAFAAGEK